jgi:flagellar P-ring protein precursor FlgI
MNPERARPNYALAIIAAIVAAICALGASAAEVRDLTDVRGVRQQQLVGYGLVVGLQKTGDTGAAADEAARRLLAWGGLELDDDELQSRDSALVVLTAQLPPFAVPGQCIDVRVSAVGDAESLQGGTLVTAPLYAGQKPVAYARAQGLLQVAGDGPAAALTSGVIHDGAIVSRAAPADFVTDGKVELLLRRSDVVLAVDLADAVNQGWQAAQGGGAIAEAVDGRRVVVTIPDAWQKQPVRFVAEIQRYPVLVDTAARVVINLRSGTVTMTSTVPVAPCSFAHGNIVVRVEAPSTEAGAPARETTLQEIVDRLADAGADAHDIAAVVRGLADAGAIHAEIVTE